VVMISSPQKKNIGLFRNKKVSW